MFHGAEMFHGAWWYINSNCYNSNMNGQYHNQGPGDATGLVWFYWRMDFEYSVEQASMKLRHN